MNKEIKKKTLITLLIITYSASALEAASAYNPSIEAYKLYAHMMVGSDKQYRCLVELWDRESRWNPRADNAKSSAYGIPQLLNMKSTNPYRQIELGYKFIKHRHNSPCLALAYHDKKGHY